MRRIIVIFAVVVVVVVGAVLFLRKPKTTNPRSKKTITETESASTAQQPKSRGRSAGKTAGRLKAKTKEERAAERKRIRQEEKRRRKELRRRERERKRMLKYARSRRGKRKTGRKGTYYVVKAIVSLGNESYALIDSRRVRVGDVVMGRKIVAIHSDRIEVEAFGRRTTVRVGESLLPIGYFTRKGGRL